MKLKTKVATALAVLGTLAGTYAQKQDKNVPTGPQNNIEALVTPSVGRTKARLNLFADLPLGIKDYTFVELNDGGSYFLRNITTKKVAENSKSKVLKNLYARVDSKFGTNIKPEAGIGVGYGFKLGNANLSVNAFPVWYNRDGKKEDFATVLVTANKSWNHKVGKQDWQTTASFFGELNYAAMQWTYGEASVSTGKKGGQFSYGIGVNLYNKNTFDDAANYTYFALPKPVVRGVVKFNFNKKK